MRCSALLILLASLPAQPAGTEQVKIVLIGDSTVNDEGGWGVGLRAAFTPSVQVINHARNGRSSKSFREEGRWEPALAVKPHYVLIQFGHNDQPGKGPERETDPKTTYRANMIRYIEEARAAGAVPILVTSIVRRNFDAGGRLIRDQLVPYVDEARKIAAEKDVPLIDLYELTFAQAEKLGPSQADTLGKTGPDGKPDRTHLGPKGQKEIGAMAASELARLIPVLKPLLRNPSAIRVSWRNAMQQPLDWYGSAEAIRIADNLLEFQHENGGWDKNIDMAVPLDDNVRAEIARAKATGHTTIDNGATHTQLRFLARVYSATKQARYSRAFRRGLDYLLAAQYANGGWPQFYPLRRGYYTHITFNDDAMIGVLEVLRSIARADPEFAFASDYRRKAAEAVRKGVECILKCQVVVDGRRTAWCAQHDETTLAPAKARSYELPSLSGFESVGIVGFLMSIEKPDSGVEAAIRDAVSWFRSVQIDGLRLERRPEPSAPKGYDLIAVADPAATPLWARFYEIPSNRPMFCDRDGVVKYKMSDIGYERRNGYRWYVDAAAKLLSRDYPKWSAQHGGNKAVRP